MGETEARIVGRKMTPRILLQLSDEAVLESCTAALQGLEVRSVANFASGIAPAEWDVLITDRSLTTYVDNRSVDAFSGWFVLAFGSPLLGKASRLSLTDPTPTVGFRKTLSVALEFEVPSDLPAGVDVLVERDLIPAAQSRKGHTAVEVQSSRAMIFPFLTATDGLVLAGRFERSGSDTECWALPSDVQRHDEWVLAALRHWRGIAPERFARLPGWQRDPEWFTSEERRIAEERHALDAKLTAAIQQLTAEREVSEQQAAEARLRAERGDRRLLTERSEALTAAVAHALEKLGFGVTDMDAVYPQGDRREDLRITDPDDPDWIALVEVKGYAGGAAKLNDILLFARYRERFHSDEGRYPSACWYVVNQHAGQDPAVRQPVLHSNPEELATFANDQGLLAIDTAELFKTVVAVDSGNEDAATVRARLRSTAGRFTAAPAS